MKEKTMIKINRLHPISQDYGVKKEFE